MKTDFKTIQVKVKDGVAVFSMNNPPVNQLSKHFVADLNQALKNAYEDDDVKALVITGTGKNFIAGADITQIQGVKKREVILARALEGTRFISSLETGPKPIVAAINGNCLGGGLEIAMACHYRVAARGVNLGQPEVQIGLIPGAGGTQRLPRLIGLRYALEMITTRQAHHFRDCASKGTGGCRGRCQGIDRKSRPGSPAVYQRSTQYQSAHDP